MTWIAYTWGAVAQAAISKRFRLSLYLTGYLVLFLIELCTILVNEYNDYETDRLNANFSMFTGGTRVIVEGGLSFREVKSGIWFVLLLLVGFSYLLNLLTPFNAQISLPLLIIIGLFLGLGYTIPPFKFSYRGLGEIVVSITHSIYVILCGFVFQGGMWDNPRPWVMSVPMFFSIFAAITLAGIPDRQADEAVRKKTVAVIFGPRRALMTAISCVGLAYLSAFLCWYYQAMTVSMGFFTLLVLPHGTILVFYLVALLQKRKFERKINREMGLSLAYIIWFGLLPLLSLWR